MSLQTGSVDADGIARTTDGKVYVTMAGIPGGTTPAGAPGFSTVIAQSYSAVSGAADTNENALATITIPANTLGANGVIRVWWIWTMTNSANNKTIRARYSAIGGTAYGSMVFTTTTSAGGVIEIANRGATNSQLGTPGVHMMGALSSALVTSSVDTTAATTLVITGQKASAGETLTLEGYTVEIVRP